MSEISQLSAQTCKNDTISSISLKFAQPHLVVRRRRVWPKELVSGTSSKGRKSLGAGRKAVRVKSTNNSRCPSCPYHNLHRLVTLELQAVCQMPICLIFEPDVASVHAVRRDSCLSPSIAYV